MAGNEAKTKQIIIVREDLPMNVGKVAAQVAHASLGVILNKNKSKETNKLIIDLNSNEIEWFNKKFTKIVLGVKSEEKLLKLKKEAEEAGLTVVEIVDAGHTTFNKPTLTCIGIGPDLNENIDKITKKLRMMTRTNRERSMEKYLLNKLSQLESSELENIDEILQIREILRN